MPIDTFADSIRRQIAAAFGDTSDLSEELVNTLANLYYFAEKARKQDLGGLSDLQEIHPSKRKANLVSMYMDHMNHVALSVSHAPELIQKLRAMRSESRAAFTYFEEFTLDLLKYRVADVANKSGLRRMIERKLKSPNEHSGLTRRFKLTFRRDAA